MKNALLLSAIFTAALVVPAMAADAPETRTAGDMRYWFRNAPHYALDAEGHSKLRMCHAKALDAKSVLDALSHLKQCNQEALEKDAYYDAEPRSRDWNRPVTKAPR